MRRGASILLCCTLLLPAAAAAADGFRIFESTVASVNGEVLFLSDVEREACFRRCAAMPGSTEEIFTLQEARDRLILDTLALQEQRKLLLGAVDNGTLDAFVREADSRMASCPSSCRSGISREQTREWIRRKLLLRDFFNRRVAVFVEVKDDDVTKEFERRKAEAGGGNAPDIEQVREEMYEARVTQEVRNWETRAASKSRIVLSPMEER